MTHCVFVLVLPQSVFYRTATWFGFEIVSSENLMVYNVGKAR